MNRSLYYLCLGLLVVGLALLAAAALHDFAGIAVFSEPPWIVGIALATIGGLMVAGLRQRHRVG